MVNRTESVNDEILTLAKRLVAALEDENHSLARQELLVGTGEELRDKLNFVLGP